mmetsp:Transcript_108918/g.347724  ORF Transcript_108918/g.347724 Transcript_108918/m.347724 type:complete len:121 (+) Transcript_108918:2280-2642(+)
MQQRQEPVCKSFRDLLLQHAVDSLDKCLAPEGRPGLSLCLLARARLGDVPMPASYKSPLVARSDTELYLALLSNYNGGSEDGRVAKEFCSEAYEEANVASKSTSTNVGPTPAAQVSPLSR